MASRGFRGTEARIRFSTDLSALTPAQRLLQRFFGWITSAAKTAADGSSAIQEQLQKVANAEDKWRNTVENARLAAERRTNGLLNAEAQLNQAYVRRNELIRSSQLLAARWARTQASTRFQNASPQDQAMLRNEYRARQQNIANRIAAQVGLIDRLRNSYNNLRASAAQAGTQEAQAVSRAEGALRKAQAVLDALMIKFRQAGQTGAAAFGTIVRSLLSLQTLTAVTKGGIATMIIALGAATVAGAAFGTAMNIQLERVQASLNALTNDIQTAKSVIDDAFNRSEFAPIRPDEFLEGARTILSVGGAVQTLGRDLQALAAIATVANQPLTQISVIYGEILNKNRLYREDLLQFSRRGIPVAQQLADTLGVTRSEIDELVSLGAIDFGTFQKAILDLGSSTSNYGQAFQAVTSTISGQLQLLTNDFFRLTRGAGQLVEELGGIRVIKSAIDFARSNIESFINYLEYVRKLYGGGPSEDTASIIKQVGDSYIAQAKALDSSGLEDKLRLLANAYNEVKDVADQEVGKALDTGAYTEAVQALEQAGLGDLTGSLLGKGDRDALLVFLETLRQRIQQLKTGGPSNIAILPDLAELKIKKGIIDDIPRILEDALSAEQKFKIELQAVNEEYDKKIAAIRKALAENQDGPQRQKALEDKLNKVLADRATLYKELAKRRDEELNKSIEALEKNVQIAEVIKQIPELFPNAQNVAEDVAEIVLQLRLAQEAAKAAGREFDQNLITKIQNLINQFANLEREKNFKGSLEDLKKETSLLYAQMTALKEGLDLRIAARKAEVDLDVAAGKLTRQQGEEIKFQLTLLGLAEKRLNAMERQKKLADEMANKLNPAKGLKEAFEDILGAIENFNLPLDQAARKAQELLFAALGIKDALDIKPILSTGADPIRNRVQQQALERGANEQLPVLKEIRDLIEKLALANNPEIELKLNQIIQELKKKFPGAVAPG